MTKMFPSLLPVETVFTGTVRTALPRDAAPASRAEWAFDATSSMSLTMRTMRDGCASSLFSADDTSTRRTSRADCVRATKLRGVRAETLPASADSASVKESVWLGSV
eukprot:CAMPEP_0174831338 /NCGR_PEP_ID=MMETSP1114-20130205/3036_1 /TAXON_ID=312471 /ORGANISM="Neobodo designis, Strain CCAP 1951/1" /LENGTH=106 /DNA_ID=CAMNT_0016065159 /DNA_START=262 /DNA_END=582 /DNA_ORIENTATION=-